MVWLDQLSGKTWGRSRMKYRPHDTKNVLGSWYKVSTSQQEQRKLSHS